MMISIHTATKNIRIVTMVTVVSTAAIMANIIHGTDIIIFSVTTVSEKSKAMFGAMSKVNLCNTTGTDALSVVVPVVLNVRFDLENVE